jgi:hypothetical protein
MAVYKENRYRKAQTEEGTTKAQEAAITADEARREYFRRWRQKNPEKVKAAQLRYWQRKAEAMREGAQA